MKTREEALQWLHENKYLLTTSVKFEPGQLQTFFTAYNLITGESKGLTGCGRCILNMKHRLSAELKKQPDMKKYPVYKTAKGTLTFQVKGEPVCYVHASGDADAKAALTQLKKSSKDAI